VDHTALQREKGIIFYNNPDVVEDNTNDVRPAAKESRRKAVNKRRAENLGGQQGWREHKKNSNWTDEQMKNTLAQHE